MFSIITVEREYGSGAASISNTLAGRLGWTLWDHEITCEIARRLKCDIHSVEQREERLDTAFYSLAKIFMRGSYEDSFTGSGLELLDAEHLSRLFEKVVNDVAARGKCIIVGRGAPWFLRDRPDAFHVFIYAPYDEKIRRITAGGKSRHEAEDLVERVDRERAAFIKKYYGKVWPQRDLYHLMINSKVGDELVVETILSEMEMLRKQPATLRSA
ncbi:MAG: cytidylate kinase-like family protein [Acidobacteriaceae bacterium]|nr:cytidylate kinase-like family protein [Acidobacteriaceae bacterium]MBV9294166.1 cytidylate kinase-like family protein [Acidobacteriaceae bacterium]MBV9763624.1 cytidylate kinase-like family protein [Acidobacteriaceae bacterium]